MKDVYSVDVSARGVITLPKAARATGKISEGTRLTLIDLGEGTFVLSSKSSTVDAIGNEAKNALEGSGLCLEDILLELKKLRRVA